jgi:hypothetical protein
VSEKIKQSGSYSRAIFNQKRIPKSSKVSSHDANILFLVCTLKPQFELL